MKSNGLFAVVALATGTFVSSLYAQAPATASFTSPQAAETKVNAPLQPNQTVYSARLPTPQELTNAAAAQGLTVERIEQNATSVTAAYRASDGRANIISYQILPAGGPAATPVGSAQAAQPSTTVVYAPSSPSVVYEYAPYPYYYGPWYSYPRVSIGIGVGSGYYRGGFHGWHR